jgi:hypothetical protein
MFASLEDQLANGTAITPMCEGSASVNNTDCSTVSNCSTIIPLMGSDFDLTFQIDDTNYTVTPAQYMVDSFANTSYSATEEAY